MRYERPDDLTRALELISDGGWRVLAGGTDLYPATSRGVLEGDILDISALEELRGIGAEAGGWRIGAGATWAEVIAAPLPPAFDALKGAAGQVGAAQIQNVATVAGNLCNASPAADGVPALMVLDAEVELRSLAGTRLLPVGEFILGARRTALREGELMTAIHCPAGAAKGRSGFRKLGARSYLVISIAMAAARLHVAEGAVRGAALCLGACSETARRLPELERRLTGRPANAALTGLIGDSEVADAIEPIGDMRGTADYRREAAAEILRRAVSGCLDPAESAAA